MHEDGLVGICFYRAQKFDFITTVQLREESDHLGPTVVKDDKTQWGRYVDNIGYESNLTTRESPFGGPGSVPDGKPLG